MYMCYLFVQCYYMVHVVAQLGRRGIWLAVARLDAAHGEELSDEDRRGRPSNNIAVVECQIECRFI